MPKQKRPAPSVTAGQGGADLGNPSKTADSEIDALLDEAGVGVAPASAEAPPEAAAPTPEESAAAARPGAPTPDAPVTGPKGLADAKPAVAPAAPAAPVAPIAPKDPAAPAAVTPAAPAAPATPAAPVTPIVPVAPTKPVDPEVDGLKEPVGASPEALNNFKKLREIATQRKTEITTLKTKTEELTAKNAQMEKEKGLLPKAVIDEILDHRAFRRRFDIRNDNEFKVKFDTKISTNTDEICAMLKEGKMPEDQIKALRDGGLEKQPMKWWQDNIFTPLMESEDPAHNRLAVSIKAKLENNMLLSTEKEQAIDAASKEGSQWQKEREEQVTQKQAADNNEMRTTLEELQATVSWGKLQEVPADATPEVKAKIERENAMYKKGEELLPKLLNPENPRQRIEQAALALLSFWQRDEMDRVAAESTAVLTAMQTKLEAVEAENAKLKSAGRTNKAGAAAPITPAKTGNSMENVGMKNEAAVEKLMSEMGI